jgi:hypothetical protein
MYTHLIPFASILTKSSHLTFLLNPPNLIKMFALTNTTGNLGAPPIAPSNLVIYTSDPNSSRWASFISQGIQIRPFNFKNPDHSSFRGCTKLFLFSTPQISLDFNNVQHGQGREKHHFAVIDAALKAGVRYINYTSLAFGGDSGRGL